MKKRKRAINQLNTTLKNWYRSVFLLKQDWCLDLDLLLISINLFNEYIKFRSIIENRISSKILSNITNLKTECQKISENIKSGESDLRKNLLREKYRIQKQISPDIIENISEDLINMDFPELILGVQAKIEELINRINQTYWIARTTDYTGQIRESDYMSFNPWELISFEMFPECKGDINALRLNVFQQIEEIRNQVILIDNVLIYNLETAIQSIDDKEENIGEAVGIAIDGMDRGLVKIDEIQDSIINFSNSIKEDLRELVSTFNNNLFSLSDNENAFIVRLRITKARTLQQTRQLRKLIFRKIRYFIFRKIIFFKHTGHKVKTFLRPWRKHITIQQKREVIGTELSYFLSFAYEAIHRLPVIYQRLYSIRPLDTMELFVGRSSEIRLLKKALENWESGRYAPAVVIGEKWSGLTTLLNNFVAQNTNKYKAVWCKSKINTSSSEEFLNLWAEWLETEGFTSFDQLTNYINSLPGKRIIVLEDIQNLYLKTIGGFTNLKILIELISRTQKNSFWLCSCTLYAWNYLNKTQRISDYFAYLIWLKELNAGQISDVIMKRNHISGYWIHFQPSDKDLNNRKFVKLVEDKQQEFLRAQFFKNLNAFARSNISLALTYWMLSTKDITGGKIEIGEFQQPEFSFISFLPHLHILALHVLVLHDGLNESLFAKVMNIPRAQAEILLLQMLDDGMVVQHEEVFRINPLLYRPTIQMLRAKNYIN